MIRKMKRNRSHVLLTGMAALTVFSACTSGQNTSGGSSASSAGGSISSASSSESSGTLTSSENSSNEKVNLTLAVCSNPNIEDWETNWFTKYLEEQLNVDFTFQIMPTDGAEAKTKFTLLVSSNTTLPDVVDLPLDGDSVNDFGRKGVFLDMAPYFNDAKKTPKFNAIPQKDRDFIISCGGASTNGAIYGIPSYKPSGWNEAYYRTWVNQDFMKASGIDKMPETTEDFYNMLKAFVENDPNKNGKKDEVGMVGATGWGQNPLVFLMNAFLYANPDKAYFDVQDGKIIASFVQEEWKNGLEYIYRLVDEGLLSPLSFTQDTTQLKSLINVENGMAGVVSSGSYSVFDKTLVGDPVNGNGYVLLPPLKGPEGKSFTPQNPTLPTFGYWNITKDCKNPDRAVLVGDFFLDWETSTISQNGEPGVDWSNDPEIMKKYTLTKVELDE